MSERDQFETAWVAANSDSEEKAEVVRNALRNIWRDNGSGGGAYFDSLVMMAWTWWQASREALKAEQEGDREHWYLVSYSEQGGRVGSIEIGIPGKWSKGDALKVRQKIKEINNCPGEVIIVSICEIDGSAPSQPHPIDTTSQQYETLAKGDAK